MRRGRAPARTDRAALMMRSRCRPAPAAAWRVLVVTAILGFLLLPALVVTLAAFNDRAILSFPPETWSLALVHQGDRLRGFPGRLPQRPDRDAWASSHRAGRRRGLRLRARPLRVPLQAGARGRAALAAGGAALHGRPRLSDPRGAARRWRAASRWSSPAMSCWCCRSCCAASTSRCAISTSAWSSPPRASARRRAACSSPSRCRCWLPGLVSGWLFAAILSFNEFTASLFVTAQRTQTLPVAMYNYVREYADPSMAAISVIYHRGRPRRC